MHSMAMCVLAFYSYFGCIFSEASETRHALHGVKWPSSNPKCLNVDFGTENVMLKAIDSTANDVKPNMLSRDDRIVSSNELHDTNRERVSNGIVDHYFELLTHVYCIPKIGGCC